MLYPFVVTLSLALSALAAPHDAVQRRAATDINNALNMVKTGVDSLDTSVKAIRNSSDITGLGNLATKSASLGKTLMQAQTMVQASQPIGLIDALSVMNSAKGLTTSLQSVTTDLVAQKPAIQGAGLNSVVAQMLTMQKTASTGLTMAVTSKLPAIAAPLAAGTMKDITQALDTAINAFSSNSTSAANPNAGLTPKPAATNPSTPSPKAGNGTTTSGGKGGSSKGKEIMGMARRIALF